MKYPKLLQSSMGGLGGCRQDHINHTSLLCLAIIFSSNHKTICHHITIKNKNSRNILPLSCASFPLWRSLRLSLQRKSSYFFQLRIRQPGFLEDLGGSCRVEQECLAGGGNRQRSGELLVASPAAFAPTHHSYSRDCPHWPQHCTVPPILLLVIC